jgi:hypothetical protein
MSNTLKRFILSVTCLLLLSTSAFAENPSAQIAFEQLKSLEGRWKEKGSESSSFSIEFVLTANDTVLVERWLSGEKLHSLTLYHLDKDHLLATHYCPQNNQPRLKMSSSSNNGSISFDFMDVTNLVSEKQSYQHSLGFSFSTEGEGVIRSETYMGENGAESSSFTIVRKK